MNISLLPGWGWGLAPMQPLADALSRQHEVRLLPLPDSATPGQALEQLDTQIPADSWLIGWSLGGMLATALAHRRGNACPGLVTLGSNACFVARPDWPQAMPERDFHNFSRRARRDWTATLERFQQLCLLGETAERAEPAARLLDPSAAGLSGVAGQTAQLDRLAWLAQLDNREALRSLSCRQLHVLADADALVPASVAEPLAGLNAQASIRCLPGSHAFVVTQQARLASLLVQFIG